MHLALFCPNYTGHYNPMFTLGRALQRRGHRVTQVGLPPTQRPAEAAGLGFLPIGADEPDPDRLPRLERRLAELQGVAALIHTGIIFDINAAIALRDLPGVLERGKFDAVLIDQISPAVPVCDALSLPYGVVCNALAMHPDPAVPPGVTSWVPTRDLWSRLRNRLTNWILDLGTLPIALRMRAFCRAHKLPRWTFARNMRAGLVQVAQQPAFFDFPREQLPDHFHYTGPWHEPGRDVHVSFPWERLDGRPIVYASLGTVQNRAQTLLEAIARACRGMNVQLVLTLGGASALSLDGAAPDGAIVVPYAPQLELIRRAAAVITHAGLNTSLETLAAGLPMVAIPLANDQPGNARRLASLGAAELVPPEKATPTRLHKALQAILTRSEYRLAARRYQAKLRDCPTVDETARLVEWPLLHRERLTRTRAVELGLARSSQLSVVSSQSEGLLTDN
jgi:MGT family glycosyltransferase